MSVDPRPYHPSDLYQYYRICLQTGAAGEDATGVIDEELLGHYYVAPYCQHDPALCFTLTFAGAPSGYIIGTADTSAFAE